MRIARRTTTLPRIGSAVFAALVLAGCATEKPDVGVTAVDRKCGAAFCLDLWVNGLDGGDYSYRVIESTDTEVVVELVWTGELEDSAMELEIQLEEPVGDRRLIVNGKDLTGEAEG